jgi:aspartate racemase
LKTIGIVGGIGPESTIEYYRYILAAAAERQRDGAIPSIIINSIDVNKLLALAGANQLGQLTAYLLEAVNALARAGAHCGLLASNTPHIVFDDVQRQSPIPLISIVEAVCEEAKKQGLKKPVLFGTRITMRGRFYPEVFSKAGLDLAVPSLEEQDYIHGKYVNELLQGIFLPETRAGLLDVVAQLKERKGIDSVILGGTELPLILRDSMACGIPLLDTAKIHARSIVNYASNEPH